MKADALDAAHANRGEAESHVSSRVGQEAMARAYAKGDEARSADGAVESFVSALLVFLGPDRNFLRPFIGRRSRIEAASPSSSAAPWVRLSPRSARPPRKRGSQESA